jgi:FkbM family methyltransferase
MSTLPSPYRQARYIPHAVSGKAGRAVMHLTKSPHCCSLLKPRHTWLKRFSYHDLFEETGTAEVECVTLDHLAADGCLRADVIKLDTQGLELQILQTASCLLPGTICIEAETGYVENYTGETVSSQVDQFLRSQGFLLFDLTLHRVGRANGLAALSRKQPLWCESLWLKDYLAQESWDIPVPLPDRLEACKALLICRALGFADYGYEIGEYFHARKIITGHEFAELGKQDTWAGTSSRAVELGARLFQLLPGPWRRKVLPALERSVGRPHILRELAGRLTGTSRKG